jgi:uncharacterized metal-binding protein
LLGSAGRLAYLAGIVLLAAAALESLGLPALAWLRANLPGVWQEHRPLLISALAGVEASSWLHLIQDGDPMPRLPRPLRWLLRRRRTRRSGRRP